MVDALTTNHTSFMREQAHFDFLTAMIVPAIPAVTTLQIWSGGFLERRRALFDCLRAAWPHRDLPTVSFKF